jgi:hypothetical protein
MKISAYALEPPGDVKSRCLAMVEAWAELSMTTTLAPPRYRGFGDALVACQGCLMSGLRFEAGVRVEETH